MGKNKDKHKAGGKRSDGAMATPPALIPVATPAPKPAPTPAITAAPASAPMPETPRQRARASLMITRNAGMTAEAEWTSTGMLSIAVLVSSILLSSAVIVRAARKGPRP